MMCMTRWEWYNTKESAVLVFFLLSAHFDMENNYLVEIQVENFFFSSDEYIDDCAVLNK